MREIKFRAWDKAKEKMFIPIRLTFIKGIAGVTNAIGDRDVNPESNDYIVMQFTGLLDCNGKEIYESDIVKIPAFNPSIVEVVFNRGGFCLKQGDDDNFYSDIKYAEEERGEVIGNVYENENLLNKNI